MRVTYSPEGGEAQHWEYEPGKVRAGKAEMIEKRFGGSWDQFNAAVMQGSMRARRVLLWHFLALVHPTLRYEDTPDFYAAELVVSFTSTELRDLRERLLKASLPSDEREAALTALDIQITEAMAEEGIEADEVNVGKALSNNADAATG